MTNTAKPVPVEIPEQVDVSLVDELRVPLAEWTDPGAAGRVEDQIILSID
jgi:hypothetical protein